MSDNLSEGAAFIASGTAAGAAVSTTVGGMGLAGSFGGIGIGMGAMAAAGGVVGLAAYGAYKIINQDDTGKNFHRNLQALAEITKEYEDKKRWTDLEVDAELETLKTQMQTKNNPS